MQGRKRRQGKRIGYEDVGGRNQQKCIGRDELALLYCFFFWWWRCCFIAKSSNPNNDQFGQCNESKATHHLLNENATLRKQSYIHYILHVTQQDIIFIKEDPGQYQSPFSQHSIWHQCTMTIQHAILCIKSFVKRPSYTVSRIHTQAVEGFFFIHGYELRWRALSLWSILG